ncbi:CK1/CK1 protein kinase [Cryptococcus wingfieldii CBS 7118]|uniref:CK1/CK1 protein kinase n=1 Tax=Cryptococcus wingfieldii CBS 7118 TaxID=1295528 RepID=A0A1E3IY89_9TREE|nr:CK1/CK1 protein kinase [Cryptococcus wingfieldii CBS 7118]ODN93518.1 CK1/CK1 protein kinase [Cryptococcus wingfieldii CBS 7118]
MVLVEVGQVISGRFQIKDVITHRDHNGKCFLFLHEQNLTLHATVSIYIAEDIPSGQAVALKLNHKVHYVHYESCLYSRFQHLDGFPRMYGACYESYRPPYGAFAMDLLGPSLDKLVLDAEGSKFNLKTTLQVIDQVITRIQALHTQSFIHCGIKPDNFCIGPPGANENKVYMIDFDLAKKFRDHLTKLHIPYREKQDPVGNPYWSSLNVDMGIKGSRRDDMESMGYMAVFFLKGILPWHSDHARRSPYPEFRKKSETTLEYLCQDLPEEFATYMTYCRSLKFDDEPDYDHCRGLFRQVFEREGFEDDGVYDWAASELELDIWENEPSPGSPQVSAWGGGDDTDLEIAGTVDPVDSVDTANAANAAGTVETFDTVDTC